MRARMATIALALTAAGLGLLVASAVGSAGAPTQTVTLGSTSGTPSQNICVGGFNCTYVPYLGVSNPELQVPFDGTVTSFAVNSGSTGNTVRLRVLRPASGGQFTGVGTSPAETLAPGVTTFAVSLPVKAGDVLALDNADSAIMFDTLAASPIAAYYELPSLADGQTAAPNNTRTGYRLLLSATVQAAGTSTTSTTTTTGPPVVSHVAETHRAWREGTKLPKFTRGRKPPIGTTFSFALDASAHVTFVFEQQLTGRRVNGKCVATSHPKRHACKRTVLRGSLAFTGRTGTNSVFFDGRVSRTVKLPLGSYSMTITATNTAGAAGAKSLRFAIVRP